MNAPTASPPGCLDLVKHRTLLEEVCRSLRRSCDCSSRWSEPSSKRIPSSPPPCAARACAAPPVGATRDAWNSFRERQKQNAPGTASEGIRSASEDRGDRPPAERSQSMVLQPSSTHSRPYAAASRLVCAVVPMLAMWIGLNTVFPPRYPSRASRRVRTLRLRFGKRNRLGRIIFPRPGSPWREDRLLRHSRDRRRRVSAGSA